MNKKLSAFLLVICLFVFQAAAGAQDKAARLIEQLQGKAAYYDANGSDQGFFASWTTRNYNENVRIFAARQLPATVTAANRDKVVEALIKALKTGADDRDTGDGILLNRTEIAFALAKVGDNRAIKPLLQALLGREKLPMINAKAGPKEIILKKTSANLNIIKALGCFRGLEAGNAAALMEQFLIFEQVPEIADHLRGSIDLIVNDTDLKNDMPLVPSRP